MLYLIFNEGYAASSGPSLQREELTTEAIRVARLLVAVAPREPEAVGLLALMLLTDSRCTARALPDGTPVPLAEQDRRLWNQTQIEEGIALLSSVLGRGAPGPYQLQAAIAAVHAEATTDEETDWPQILALYTVLEAVAPSPVVTLNRAVAVAMVHGPGAGLSCWPGWMARLAGRTAWTPSGAIYWRCRAPMWRPAPRTFPPPRRPEACLNEST